MLNFLLTLTILTNNSINESIQIRKIHFEGNRTIKTKTLLKIISLKPKDIFYDTKLYNDTVSISAFYHAFGFNKVRVKPTVIPTPRGTDIYLNISEGPRTIITNIFFDGVKSFTHDQLRSVIKLKPNDYLITTKIELAEKAIVQWYQNNGFPKIIVETNFNYHNDFVELTFHINEGQIAFIKTITVRGNQQVSTPIIRQVIEIKDGEKFNFEKLEKARAKLYATRLFERVSFYILESEYKDSVGIRFDVLELPPRSISFGGGLQTPPASLLFSCEWQHYNFLSRRHNLFLALNYVPAFSGDWRTEVKSNYQIYYFFNVPINFIFQPSYRFEKNDSTKQHEININIGISHFLNPKLEIGSFIKYLHFWSNLSTVTDGRYSSITNSQNLYLRLDTRDDLFIPRTGVYFITNLQVAGSIFKGNNDFLKNQIEISNFYSITPQLVIGIKALIGIVYPYGRSNVVPYYETFSLGGNNGLRGYDDKAIGPTIISNRYHYGDAIINTNCELRSDFNKLINFVLFFDFGKVTTRQDFLAFNDNLLNYSSGIGIRIKTPVGPIRVDYAKRLKNPQTNDWGKFHFGLLNTF